MTPATTQLDEIPVDECLELLESQSLGRLAYCLQGKPRIRPLNFAVYQGSVVFRTGYGDLLDTIHMQDVAFEVDHAEADTHSGWSVIIRGIAEEIWRPEELDDVRRRLSLRPWAPGDRDHYVRILSSAITGRRIR
jgi:nitroimidazol reductase NimA-like FMN-containing flavoprotein (pyridoxamine 5'-phosphate oxidase superfamily)